MSSPGSSSPVSRPSPSAWPSAPCSHVSSKRSWSSSALSGSRSPPTQKPSSPPSCLSTPPASFSTPPPERPPRSGHGWPSPWPTAPPSSPSPGPRGGIGQEPADHLARSRPAEPPSQGAGLRRCCWSGAAAVEPPEAEPGQGQGEGQVHPGLGQLEGPVVAGGLVALRDPDPVAGHAVVQRVWAWGRGGWSSSYMRDVCLRYQRLAGRRNAADRLAGSVDSFAGDDPGAGVAGDSSGGERQLGVGAETDVRSRGRDGGDRLVGREQVRADQRGDELGGGEDGQGDGHGGDRAADEQAGRDAEGEAERGVAERGDAVGREDEHAEPGLAEY